MPSRPASTILFEVLPADPDIFLKQVEPVVPVSKLEEQKPVTLTEVAQETKPSEKQHLKGADDLKKRDKPKKRQILLDLTEYSKRFCSAGTNGSVKIPASIVLALETAPRSLRVLKLGKNALGNKALDEIENIATSIPVTLKQLRLSQNCFHRNDGYHLIKFLNALPTKMRLRHLSLNTNKLGTLTDTRLKLVADALAKLPLKKISLRANGLHARQVDLIFSSIKSIMKLKKIDLGKIDFYPAELFALIKKHNLKVTVSCQYERKRPGPKKSRS